MFVAHDLGGHVNAALRAMRMSSGILFSVHGLEAFQGVVDHGIGRLGCHFMGGVAIGFAVWILKVEHTSNGSHSRSYRGAIKPASKGARSRPSS